MDRSSTRCAPRHLEATDADGRSENHARQPPRRGPAVIDGVIPDRGPLPLGAERADHRPRGVLPADITDAANDDLV